MNLAIGIDTGGTYTDAVLYDFDAGRIVQSAKTLTTHRDLTGCGAGGRALPVFPQPLRQMRAWKKNSARPASC